MTGESSAPRSPTPDNQKPSALSDRWPCLAIIAIAVLALVQTIRIFAFQLAQDVLAGSAPIEWLYPAYLDMFVGITAPFVAFALWQRTGLAVWTTAIVWFTISIFDHLGAVTNILNANGPLPRSFPASSPSSAVSRCQSSNKSKTASSSGRSMPDASSAHLDSCRSNPPGV